MQPKRWRIVAASFVALSLLAAACGGDDDTEQSSVTTADGSATTDTSGSGTTGPPETTGTSSPRPAATPTSMDEWEALGAKERAATVKLIKDNKWGVSADGKTLTGPDGFKVDLSACNSGNWSSTEGLSDTEIKLGHTISLSGTTADYGNSTKTAKLVFDYYASKGAFKDSTGKDRKINYLVKDDGYDPARTIPLVDELLDSEKAFSVWSLGTANILRIYDKLNKRCVPNIFMQSGHPAFGDPANKPWTIGAPQTSYSTESVLWGSFIEQRLAEFGGKVKVASLIMNNDFGKIYDASFRAYLNESPNKDKIEYVTQTVEPQAPNVLDAMTTLASQKPQVFIAMVAAAQCTQAVIAASENGMKQDVKYLFQPAVCAGSAYVNKEKVGGDGMAADGWWLMNPAFKDFNDPAQFSDPFIAWGRDLMVRNGLDPKASSSYGTGILFAWPMVQAYWIAGQLDGGLNRANLILAARTMDLTHPGYLPGIRLHLSGNRDGYAEEAGVFQQWDGAKQVWVVKGKPIDLDGKSKPCAWDAAAAVCR